MRTKKERYSLCVGTVNIPQTLGQTQVKVLSGMCEPDVHGHNVSSFPFIHKGPQSLPAEREWFNSVWKHTLVSTLVTTAHVTAGGAWVCSLCFPLQGLLVSGNTNCHFPHCLSNVIFLIVYLNIYMLFSGESVVRWPTGSLPVKLTHGQASSKCLAFLSARSSAKISLLWTNDGGWNVAQLLEHWTVTLWMQVRFHGAASFFFSQSQLSVQTLFRCPYTPVCNRAH